MTKEEIDHLTTLPARAAFDRALEESFQKATDDRPCALIFADIDHFKKVNDKHGHQIGDEVLREVASCLMMSIEGKGFAYRYGGEEFVFVLPNHTVDEALAVAERARRKAETLKSAAGSITLSFGVAIAPSQAASSAEWLKKADEALYNAKHLGRNLVRLWGEPPPEPGKPRKPERKQAEPSTLSDEAKEELRLQYLRNRHILCPIDRIPLNVQDVTALGDIGSSFLVHCPGCGFGAFLSSPGS